MNSSPTLGELAKALSKAQSVMGSAIKSNENPYFKSKYADLAAVWDACRKPLSENGLSVVQISCDVDGRVGVETILLHSSGEWISGMLLLKPVKDDPQAAGSAITYARRYGLQAAAGVATEDDDGNAASQPDKKRVAVTDREIRLGSPTLSSTSGVTSTPVKTAAPVGGQIAQVGHGNGLREAEGSGGDNARPSSAPAAQPEIFIETLKAGVERQTKKYDPDFVEFPNCIPAREKIAFARAWERAAKEAHPAMSKAEMTKLRGEWLVNNGFVHNNEPTSALIPAAIFEDMKRVACNHIKSLKPNVHGVVVDENDVSF